MEKNNNVKLNNVELINLTPHDIIVDNGNDLIKYPPSGIIARVESKTEIIGSINNIPISTIKYGDPINIPPKKENTIYIVSSLVRSLSKRNDLVSPDTNNSIRDEKGRIVAVKGFIK